MLMGPGLGYGRTTNIYWSLVSLQAGPRVVLGGGQVVDSPIDVEAVVKLLSGPVIDILSEGDMLSETLFSYNSRLCWIKLDSGRSPLRQLFDLRKLPGAMDIIGPSVPCNYDCAVFWGANVLSESTAHTM